MSAEVAPAPRLLAAEEDRSAFRNYDQVKENVRQHYLNARQNQTVEFVQKMQASLKFEHPLPVWDAMLALNNLVDLSDPDLELPNIQHLFQSAEAVREQGLPEWMQVAALVHDLGKLMYLWGNDETGTSQAKQWAIVGDTFVVGCALPPTGIVYPEFNSLNPDMQDPRYNTELGMYQEGCGMDNLTISWGHDEYLYRVLLNHPTNKLPKEAMWMIRFHSFYPWHSGGNYQRLLAPADAEKLKAIKDFNRFDLYSKDGGLLYNVEEMKARYLPILERWLGAGPIYF